MKVAATILCLLLTIISVPAGPPKIPIGAVYNSDNQDEAYVERVAKILREQHFNAIVAPPGFARETCDILLRHGVYVVTRDQALLDHPAVIGGLLGETRPGVDLGAVNVSGLLESQREWRAASDKPVAICLPGERLGTYPRHPLQQVWDQSRPQPACLSWYGLQDRRADLVGKRLNTNRLSYSSVLRIALADGGQGYWMLLQGFDTKDRAVHKGELYAMGHMALAWGSRGVFYNALFGEAPNDGLLDPETLHPRDMYLLTQFGREVTVNADLLLSLRPGQVDIRCGNPHFEVVGQVDAEGRQYAYVVDKNQDRSGGEMGELMWWTGYPTLLAAKGIYRDAEYEPRKHEDEPYQTIGFDLRGGCRLLRLETEKK